MNKVMNNDSRIWTPKGTGLMLARRFSVSPRFVSMALTGQRSSATARNIRAVAVREYNGKEIL